jgi:hypothetical protein
MLPSETKFLEGVLETALGVTRKKPVKKPAAAVKTTAKKVAKPKAATPAKKVSRRSSEFF